MPRGKLPSGFGKTLKALYAQGYTAKDAMREAWKIHRGSGVGMHREQQPQKYLSNRRKNPKHKGYIVHVGIDGKYYIYTDLHEKAYITKRQFELAKKEGYEIVYDNPISHKKALTYARELVKHEKAGVKENPKKFTISGASFRRRGIYAFERGTHRPIRKREWEKIRGLRQNPIVVYNPEMRPRIQVSKKSHRGKLRPKSPLKGFKINPKYPLAIRSRLPLSNVEIRYQRSGGEYRGEWFRHTFKSSVDVYGTEDGSLLIRSKSGKKLWGTV